MTTAQIPPNCPKCGRLSIDNRRHCKPADEPGALGHWAKFCLMVICSACGTHYHNHGQWSP